jgi:GNAT superfamily N-acetyltransferase
MNMIAIREARAEDLAAIISLYRAPDMDGDKVLSIEQGKAVFERMNAYPNYKIFVATAQDQIVGAFALLIMDNLAHMGAPSGVVEDVIVHPEWRRRGIGKLMMASAAERCQKFGCYKMALSSNRSRGAAHRFYESLGFEKHGYSFRITPKHNLHGGF